MNVTNSPSISFSTTQSSRTASINLNKTKETALSEQDLKQLRQLKARDQVVRAHEAAHLSAGSGIVRSGASFTFQRGPDGVQYAIGGEVSIDTSKVPNDPNATLQKAQQIQAAALAPAQPSSQDRAVAARAAQMAIEARAEIAQQFSPNRAFSGKNTSSGDESNVLGKTLDITA